MEACGIIAEYNPLHGGHIYHIQKTKEETRLPIVVAMSGSFLQRGEPALLDKFTRAKLAVLNGADLVLELPTAFTLRSAQFFATGGVELLKATGVVSTLSCGAENPSQPFKAAAEHMSTALFQEQLHQLLRSGLSYAAACSRLLEEAGLCSQLEAPNDILALEYTKALLPTNIQPLYLQREGTGYNSLSLEGSYASASAIRNRLSTCTTPEEYRQALKELQKLLPSEVLEALTALWKASEEKVFTNPANYQDLLWQLLKYQLLLQGTPGLQQTTLVSEGLENLLIKAMHSTNYPEAILQCTGKRYPASRIRRLFCQLLLGLPKEYYLQEKPAYLRVLAFNHTGRQLLKSMKTTATLPLLTKIGGQPWTGQNEAFRQQLELDFRATDCWSLIQQGRLPLQSDYLISPAYITK